MRLNLSCPYSQKDEAKALGARWDVTRKVWYIVDVEDLTPFMRWLPQVKLCEPQAPKPKSTHHKPVVTGTFTPLCECDVAPWEDCEHTEALASRAMRDMLAVSP